MILLIAIEFGCFVALIYCLVMLIRNEQISSYIRQRIHEAYDANIADLSAGRFSEELSEARWAWVRAHLDSWDRMMFRFWRRLDSFHGRMP